MTDIDTMRDELARLCGWSQSDWGSWVHPDQGERLLEHPLPSGDLTALAAAWPKGWWWERSSVGTDLWWCAFPPRWDGEDSLHLLDTGDEFADRLRLTLAVLKAERGGA